MISLISHVCGSYPNETKQFPDDLIKLLSIEETPGELREKIVMNLVMLKNKKVITSEKLVNATFPLLTNNAMGLGSGQHVKILRSLIYSTMITILKTDNQKAKNHKLNRNVQALLFNLLDDADLNGLWATKLTRELWRRGIWDDARTVEIMTIAALHSDTKVSVSAVKFFLGVDKEREEMLAAEEDQSDEESLDMASIRHKMKVSKKQTKKSKKLDTALKQYKKKLHGPKTNATALNFSAIHLLNDPQGFAEKLFTTRLATKSFNNKLSLENKILYMKLISRLIGTHKLEVFGIYSYFLKYLTPKQQDVTQIMASAAQAAHDLVPPEIISDVVRKIADEFVSDGVSSEVAAAGLNTIREIVARAPLAIEQPLLLDLVAYQKSKAKPVSSAAKSLIDLFREIDPEMLERKDRGKVASMALQHGEKSSDTAPKFGVERGNVNGIPGIELLVEWKRKQLEAGGVEDVEGRDEDWEVDENSDEESNDDDDDWVKIESDKEYSVSDSEDEDNEKDEERPKKKQKLTAEQRKDIAEKMFIELSTKILTPADFAKLEELKAEAGLSKIMGGSNNKNEDEVDHTTLVGAVKYKQSRQEKIDQANEGREDRGFGSKKGIKDKAHSTTNKEKARKKNFLMTLHKRSIKEKNKMSLRDKTVLKRQHIEKQKKKGF